MKQALQDYYREVEEKAEKFVQVEEMSRREEHVRAFNLGRMVQRVEKSRYEAWLRVGWLLAGLVIGLVIGRIYPDYLYPILAHKFLNKASVGVRSAGKTGILSIWKNLKDRA